MIDFRKRIVARIDDNQLRVATNGSGRIGDDVPGWPAGVGDMRTLAVVQHGQKRVIRDLFDFYLEASAEEGGDRRLFPPGPRALLEEEPDRLERRVRIVVDLIAGLTEQSAIQLHQRLIGGSAAPTLDATAQMA